MSELSKSILQKLKARADAELSRAAEWRRSLKPTWYRGNNLFQEMGGEPLEGRYLGQQGLVPGQTVPNIGRIPNKPVIPGLPVQEEGLDESVVVIKTELDIVFLLDLSGSFSDDLPVWRKIFPDLLSSINDATKARVGIGSFVDQPFAPFGDDGDYAYRKELDMPTEDGTPVVEWSSNYNDALYVINNAETLSGRNLPESSLYALNVAATGGEYAFRDNVDRILCLITDAGFHYNEPGSPGENIPRNEFYPTRLDTAIKLKDAFTVFLLDGGRNRFAWVDNFLDLEYPDPDAAGEFFTLDYEYARLSSDSSNLRKILLSLLSKKLVFRREA